jgi:transketolase
MKSCRDGFGDALVELGKKNKNIVAITADLSQSVRMDAFKKRFPERFFDVGVAEQNLIGVASGLAHLGKIPFASSFGAFMPGMCFQQIRTAVSYNNANVKLVASHCGINVGEDGATHQMLEDISMMRSLPNMIVVSPCDYWQAKKAVVAVSKAGGPCYVRFGREEGVLTSAKTPFVLGKAQVLKDGKDIAVVGCGGVLAEALKAAEFLESEISVMVVNMHTIKPIDELMLFHIAKKCGRIIVVEDHSVHGGLGSAVSDAVSEGFPVPVYKMGMKTFGESGSAEELIKAFHLKSVDIIRKIKSVV